MNIPLVRPLFDGAVDLVGDPHGEIDALHGLLARLGYREHGIHPEGRRLVFLGDLTDRGPDSLFSEPEREALSSGKVRKQLYERINYVYDMRHEAKREGTTITKDDVFTAIVVLDFIARHPNKDNMEPSKRAEAIWTCLHRELPEVFPRAWDNSRWAALRNTFADCQFVQDVDPTYWFFRDGGKRGKPMQWFLKEAYCINWEVVLSGSEEEGGTSIRERFPPFIAENWRPVLQMPGELAYDEWTGEKLTEFLLSCAA